MNTNNSVLNLSVAQLRKAADVKERIDTLNQELLDLLSSSAVEPISPVVSTGKRGGRRQMSAAGRARIAAAARARWTRIRSEKGQGGGTPPSPSTAPKRTMSLAARRKIAAAARARWAKIKATQVKS